MSTPDYVTIVSGLPRSGTSMMMRMLEAGGLGLVVDQIRQADSDNLNGYYEFEPVKKVKTDASWLPAAQGKAVKMVYALLYDLPDGFQYRVLFMRRKLEEVMASQNKMLARRGRGPAADDATMTELFRQQLDKIERWLATQPNFRSLDVDYNRMIQAPWSQLPAINAFLDNRLDADAMAAVVDPEMYRNRG